MTIAARHRSDPLPPTMFAPAWVVFVILTHSLASAPTTFPPPPGATSQSSRDHELIREARRLLISEALDAKKNQQLPTLSPDFAQRFDREIPNADLSQAILEPTHRDPFVDAYVRWQLTSFDPALPEFNDQQFADFMDNIAALVQNPRADPQIIDTLERLAESAVLPAQRLQQLQEDVAELDRRTTITAQFNEPAISFAQWVQRKLGETGPRPRQWLLARCAATIRAGWSTRSIKTRITRNFTASLDDKSFTTDHRRLVVQQAQQLVGFKRRFVNEVTFLANGSVRVTFSTGGVDRDDVKRWSDRLAGIRTDR